MRPIDADVAYDKLTQLYKNATGQARKAFSKAIDVITDCDTLSDTDYGKWEPSTYFGYVRCSNCGLGVMKDEAGSNCPCCGVSMRRGIDNG